MKNAVFTQILNTTRIFKNTTGYDSEIIHANNAHQEKINNYTKAMDPDDICKISTTPLLTDKVYSIVTTITHINHSRE